MELLLDGFKLLVMGMGWVFLFLTLMIIVIDFVSKTVAPYAHLLENEADGRDRRPSRKTDSDVAIMAAVAAAAVRAHRKRGRDGR